MVTDANILVVDDDPLLRLGMVCMLKEMGYEPIAAHDPKRALPMAHSVPKLSLLITDYQMPGMTGVELARQMVLEHPGLSVLIVTGNPDLPDDLHPDWRKLTKPFTPHELQRALKEIRSH